MTAGCFFSQVISRSTTKLCKTLFLQLCAVCIRWTRAVCMLPLPCSVYLVITVIHWSCCINWNELEARKQWEFSNNRKNIRHVWGNAPCCPSEGRWSDGFAFDYWVFLSQHHGWWWRRNIVNRSPKATWRFDLCTCQTEAWTCLEPEPYPRPLQGCRPLSEHGSLPRPPPPGLS